MTGTGPAATTWPEDRIIRGGTVALALLLPVTYWPEAATAKQTLVLGLGISLAGALVWRAARGQKSHPIGGLAMAWLGFLAVAGLSLLAAEKPYQGAKALFLLGLSGAICLAVAGAWRADGFPRFPVAAIGLGGAMAAPLALGAILLSTETEVGIVPFGNANYAGAYFATVAPLTLGMALGARGGLRWLHGAAFLLLTVTLALTKARGGWVAFLAGMIVMAACRLAVRGFDRKGAGLALWGTGSMLLLAEAALRLRGDSVLRIAATILDPAQPTNQARLIWWGDTLRMVRDAPVLGVGIGNFTYVYLRYASLDRLPFLQPNPYLEHPHNEYLGLAAEVGLLGLAAFLGILIAGAVGARRALRVRSEDVPETAGLVGGAAAGVVNAVFFYTWHSPAGIAFWMILGLLGAAGQQSFEPPVGRPATRERLAPRVVAALGVAGIAVLGFVLGVRPLVSTTIAQRALVDWYALRGTEALEGFRRAIAWEADNYLVPFEAGMGFYRASLLPRAAEAFAEAARVHPTHLAARNNLGLTLARLGEIARAKAWYREALAINPEYAVARNNLANILLSERDIPGAIREYRRALQSHSGYAEAWYNLAVALAESGQGPEAIRAFRQAAAFDPTMTEATRRAEELEARLGQAGNKAKMSP